MRESHLVIIGGGLAGLSAGCYARRSGLRTTIVEHNLALGGVCSAWQRGPYTIDGCIHWLTGGAFSRIYEELGILKQVPLRVLSEFMRYRNPERGFSVSVGSDLDALVERLAQLAPEDRVEFEQVREGAREFAELEPPLDAGEVTPLREQLLQLWESREALGAIVHFRKSVAEWSRTRLKNDSARRLFTHLVPDAAPALFLLMVLGYLERGYLSRPLGGAAAFRDALERSYREAGGEALLHATVDEVLVDGERACGVRLADGTIIGADYVLSTASSPETVLRLLGGRYDAGPTRERLAHWQFIGPIVLASFGVENAFAEQAPLQMIDGIAPIMVGGRSNDYLYVRVCNDDPSLAPAGHSVVQVMLQTSYEWWATRGSRYGAEKDAVADTAIAALEPHFPGLRSAVRTIDIATPLTYWTATRSWRGAFEGWIPTANAFFAHPKKTLRGLHRFYMAGQWVEPGGGIPTAVMSGRQAVQLLCEEAQRRFVPRAE